MLSESDFLAKQKAETRADHDPVSVATRILFGNKSHIKVPFLGDFAKGNSAFSVEVRKSPGESDYFQLILTRQDGQEVIFGIDEQDRILRGDWRDYPLEDDEIRKLKSAATRD